MKNGERQELHIEYSERKGEILQLMNRNEHNFNIKDWSQSTRKKQLNSDLVGIFQLLLIFFIHIVSCNPSSDMVTLTS